MKNTKTGKKNIPNIIISRTDSIGDVVLTLPIAKALKDVFPHLHIAFMGKAYTKAVIEACAYVDQFIDITDFLNNNILVDGNKPACILHVFPVAAIAKRAQQLQIPLRIGTTNRVYHWLTCNKLVKLSRRKSDLHEAQLNLKLLSAFGINTNYSLNQIAGMYGFSKIEPLQTEFRSLLNPKKYNLILHPKSQGSAREWGIENFIQLVQLLDAERYHLFVSGTKKERAELQPLFNAVGDKVTDISGAMSLGQFMSFINACNGLVACSTGPLHIAAALGKDAFGIYPPIKPMHPGRWAPIGENVDVFVLDKECNDCRHNSSACHCIKEVTPYVIEAAIEKKYRSLFNDGKHLEAE